MNKRRTSSPAAAGRGSMMTFFSRKFGFLIMGSALVLCSRRNGYGSDHASLDKKARSVALEACKDSGLTESAEIVQAMQTNNLPAIAKLLKTALEEWKADQRESPDYAAM